MAYLIQDVMQSSGVKFGTSGARGLATEMTDQVCYIYTKGFLQYLEQVGELKKSGESVAIAGDLRPSTGRIMTAVAQAARDMGYNPVNSGRVPSPAVALYGLVNRCPAVMVTGSHIPADRNGIKFNKCSGEILKTDETGIVTQEVELPENLFTADGFFSASVTLPTEDPTAGKAYQARYQDAFAPDCLAGKKIGIYQHSAVGREVIVDIFKGLGADVVALGYSEEFIPVDTEAVRPEDVALARGWSSEHGLDCIISTDGDSDRPLISDEKGEWLRGDVAGILAAQFLAADSISTPVSCNSAVEACGSFDEVRRTRIGSPFVVAAMLEASEAGRAGVVGYEANGGFLTNSDFTISGNSLRALPTRDAVLPALCILLLSIRNACPISKLLEDLPQLFTASDRIQEFPTEDSAKILARYDRGDASADQAAIEQDFGSVFGKIAQIDRTDGLRATFESAEVLHLRPSGNAPEFRCYNEASSTERVLELQRQTMKILLTLKQSLA